MTHEQVAPRRANEPIAIIGMACLFPQAPGAADFWRNILAGEHAIGEPLPQWDARRYMDSQRIRNHRGGFLKELYRFDPKQFGIMPGSLDGCEPDQFLALRVARDALEDAGYPAHRHDHSQTGIVLGHSTYLHRAQGNHIQHHIVLDQTMELLETVLPHLGRTELDAIRDLLARKLPQSNADVAPGMVPSVMTGRIANRLDLKGPAFLIDASCASSLLAVASAMDELRSGRSRLMLAGGVNASLPPEVYVIFTQLGTLSAGDRVRPFEAGSDGTLLGEGLGMVALKRLSDALADGDRIYALVRGVGQASDGRGAGLLTPSAAGEALAIERAYAQSDLDPASVELIEAHGTGIPLGDRVEIAALKKIWGPRRADLGNVALGSVKALIGHCIPAAGIAGLIKAALALHHKILPPAICCEVDPHLGLDASPFYMNTCARPWFAGPEFPRRAGINSFGFGGINAHAVLEQAPPAALQQLKTTAWPFELCVFSDCGTEGLLRKIGQVTRLLEGDPQCPLGQIAAALAAHDRNESCRLAIVAQNSADLAAKLNQASDRLQNPATLNWATRTGIIFSRCPLEGKLAFMFPGEGSQYTGMLTDLALVFDQVRGWFDFWRGLYDDLPGNTRTDIVFPPQSELTAAHREALQKRMTDADVGSEAVFVAGQALYALLESMGVRPDAMVGHSSGESSALCAGGALASGDPAQLAGFMREINKVYQGFLNDGQICTGAMLAVGALPQTTIREHLAGQYSGIMVAMDNCSNQVVLFGQPTEIRALQETLQAAGGICIPLPFDRAYHTPHFTPISAAFLEGYERIGLMAPSVPLFSCASAGLFSNDPRAVRQLAASQWSQTVRFRETVEAMYRDGFRYFVEVGPSANLSSFANDILAGRNCLTLPTNQRHKNDLEQFLTVLAHLYVNRKSVSIEHLFSRRALEPLSLEQGRPLCDNGIQLDNTLPVLHLNDSERAALRAIVSGPAAPCANHRIEGAQPRAAADPIRAVENHTPFLDAILENDGRCLVATCHLDIYEDNFLRDHILSGPVSESDPDLLGLACVPLSVSLEILAQACALLAGSTAVTVIENIKTYDWIALDDGHVTLAVHAQASDSSGHALIYSAHLVQAGAIVVSADFGFTADWRLLPLPELSHMRPFAWDNRELYANGMFHGPIFQSIAGIKGWDDQGIDAALAPAALTGFFTDNHTPAMVLNPVLLDAIGQSAAYWIAQQAGTDFNSFPSSIGRIELYRTCPCNMPGMTLRARRQPPAPAEISAQPPRAFDFECLDPQGHPIFRVNNLLSMYFPVSPSYCKCRRDPLHGWLGHPYRLNEHQRVSLWRLPLLPIDFCGQSGAIFLRILANALLSSAERIQWRALKSPIRHKRQWLLGRACIKEVVRYHLFHQTGILLYPSDITVAHDTLGAPYVDGWWTHSLAPAPDVSLSHDNHFCLAAAAPPDRLVGVDIEQMQGRRHPELMHAALSPAERAALHGSHEPALSERILRTWCAKEAAAKFIGTGLGGKPDQFDVTFVDNGWNMARVHCNRLIVEVDVSFQDGMIVALATRMAEEQQVSGLFN